MCNEVYTVIIRSADYVSGTQYVNIQVNVGQFLPDQATQKWVCRLVQFSSDEGAADVGHDFLEFRVNFNAPNLLDTGSGAGNSLCIMPCNNIGTGITSLDFEAPKVVVSTPNSSQWTVTLTRGITQAAADITADWVAVLEFTPVTFKELDYGQIKPPSPRRTR